jgi:ATPase family associated with various cellular activities (AAA)
LVSLSGTGKTTVARVIAEVLFSLSLLPSNKIVETSALDLTADYVGQTTTKVNEALNDAKGGVLFIDEAYNLGFGPFGKEACDTIVAAMTSEKFKDVVIVIAGYPHEIDSMLNSNAGLKSRFTHYFEFPDWKPDDCKSFFELLCAKKKFSLADGASDAVEMGCGSLIELDGWANGRDVTKLWEQVKSNRDARVYDSGETNRIFVLEDVNKAISSMLAARAPKADKRQSGTIPFHEMPPPAMVMDSMNQNASPQVQNTKLQESNPPDKKPNEDQAFEPATKAADERDDGVADEVWSDLQAAKERDRARHAQLQREQEEYEQWQLALVEEREQEAQRWHELELERIRLEILQREEQERAIREAEEKERQRKERKERERQRREVERLRREEEIRKATETQKRLRMIGNCPMGYVWHKMGSGWRCAGGGHYVSDEQLNRQFGHDA